MELRKALIRLAFRNPELRTDLMPLIRLSASAISADDVVAVLTEQPGNSGKTSEWLKNHWITSRSFKLTTVHAHLPDLGVTPGKTGESRTPGPIIVEENFQQIARGGEGLHGAAPDFLVLDGQNRVVRERAKGPRAVLQAYVGDAIFNSLRQKDDLFGKAYRSLENDIQDYLNTSESPGGKLQKLKQYVGQGLMTPTELEALRAQWKKRHRS